MKECNQVYDLRSALERLRSIPGQLVETDVQVDPAAGLAGVYRHVGAGGTVLRRFRAGMNGCRVGLVAVKTAGAVFAYQLAVFNHAGESV